jgi:hypothetical protein
MQGPPLGAALNQSPGREAAVAGLAFRTARDMRVTHSPQKAKRGPPSETKSEESALLFSWPRYACLSNRRSGLTRREARITGWARRTLKTNNCIRQTVVSIPAGICRGRRCGYGIVRTRCRHHEGVAGNRPGEPTVQESLSNERRNVAVVTLIRRQISNFGSVNRSNLRDGRRLLRSLARS